MAGINFKYESLQRLRIKIGLLINPFYIYCLTFSLAILVYSWGWSALFPKLSLSLLLFFGLSFIIFIYAGYIFGKRYTPVTNSEFPHLFLNDFMFGLIILLGVINIILMGYLPILDRSRNYREFGIPVIDPLFNTLSIFFSVIFLQSFLCIRKKRYLFYLIVILLFQVLLFRRSTIIWILMSSSFLLLYLYQRINIMIILGFLICIPLFSFCFGLYGNIRSNLTKSFVLNDLGASESFKKAGLGHNHYMTYLYISSPLANLQKNINESSVSSSDIKSFFLFNVIPESVTLRLNKTLPLKSPDCFLITPDLIVGTFLMVSFCTLGWTGMILMLFFLFFSIHLCLFLIRKFETFQVTTFCILSTAVSLLIFSNFLNRLDVIIMLFIYPVIFHFIYSDKQKEISG